MTTTTNPSAPPLTTTSTTKPEVEVIPEITAIGLNPALPLYILWLRRGNRAPETKYFQFKGNLIAAINKSRIYCEQMGYRFCGTYPFITDLDKELEARNKGEFIP